MLIEKMPGMSRVYYSNSGSEANEKAYKMVRQIAHRHHGGKKWKILYRERDYHGTTIATLSAGGQPQRNAVRALPPASSRCRIALNTASSGTWRTTASAPPTRSRR
jgi:adenosylmethionine-8-amino-7-oxononanoate aminotransferase